MQITTAEPRQDSNAEKALAELFALERNLNRMADEDAVDEDGNPYQFKASTKAGISTCRNFGPATIEKLRRVYLIIAWGNNHADHFEVERTFFLSTCHIEPWLAIKEAKFIVAVREAEAVLAACRRDGFDAVRLDALKRRLHYGMLLNDPNIPKGYILQHGIEIIEKHAATLRELVIAHPASALARVNATDPRHPVYPPFSYKNLTGPFWGPSKKIG